ncbi:hypothetical protein JXA27_09495 [Aerococcaceae bacterium zg-B36]|uniref:hypothetical protein n=1 Tax=Aerococcaceae bacterium zg-252 TaxID=2796928 RepID=UPI001BD83852|nr:hypothetical protein [Aerococcaceae bacterium zg-B36]
MIDIEVSKIKVIVTDKPILDSIVIINQMVVWYGADLLQDKIQNHEGLIFRLESKELVKEFLDKIGEVSVSEYENKSN